MSNKKDDPFGCGGMLVFVITMIITGVLSYKFELDVMKTTRLRYLIFGIIFTIWYLIAKIKK